MHPRVYRHDTAAPRTTRGTLPRQDRRGLARCQLPRQHRRGRQHTPHHHSTCSVPCIPIRRPHPPSAIHEACWPLATGQMHQHARGPTPSTRRSERRLPINVHLQQGAVCYGADLTSHQRRLLAAWRYRHRAGRMGGVHKKVRFPAASSAPGLLAMGVVTGGFIPYPFLRLLPGNG